jgi:dTDP-4-dehydrorhamnose 3,5-epimerase
MEFKELSIPGLWLLTPTLVSDERGFFRRSFCVDEFAAHGLAPQTVQGNISVNSVKGTMRGFHYQQEPHGEAKTLTCVTGGIFNVVVDLRRESPTFLRSETMILDAIECRSVHVPKGCANAYLTLEEGTIIHYYMSERYVPGAARGFRYDDPAFGIAWPVPPELVSAKDLAYEPFDVNCL